MLCLETIATGKPKAGLRPAIQIRVSGCSGMALAHSRGTSCDSFGGQYRLPVGRHGYEPSPNILKSTPVFYDSFSGVRY